MSTDLIADGLAVCNAPARVLRVGATVVSRHP